MVNVFSDSVGAAIVSKLCEHKLAEDPCDRTSLPEPEEDVLGLPGGLQTVDLDLEARRQSMPARALRMVDRSNGDISRTRSMPNNSDVDNPTCVYVVDEETIVLRF